MLFKYVYSSTKLGILAIIYQKICQKTLFWDMWQFECFQSKRVLWFYTFIWHIWHTIKLSIKLNRVWWNVVLKYLSTVHCYFKLNKCMSHTYQPQDVFRKARVLHQIWYCWMLNVILLFLECRHRRGTKRCKLDAFARRLRSLRDLCRVIPAAMTRDLFRKVFSERLSS